MRIPEDTIAEIRARADIVAVVGEYVRLKKSGANFTGLCPFHNEKTPSFNVNPARRIFKCFGCGVAGDVFKFIMQLEGRNFGDVARQLAERTGVEIPVLDAREERAARAKRAEREKLRDLMDRATGYFVRQLAEHEHGGMARAVIEARGVDAAHAEKFRLGYAPPGWSGLADYLGAEGHDLRAAAALGLIGARRSGAYYDRFRHRLMFPITDTSGHVIAFSGRAIDPPPGAPPEDRPPAKYINSPEGPLYTKGEVLYGLFEGRVETRRRGWLLLCEGNFDLVALHQADFPNSVAPMGTAFTEAHAKLVRRFAETAYLLFDGDAAGRKATRVAGEMLLDAGVAVKVVTLPPGEDPDSFMRSRGADALTAKVDAAPGLVDYLIDGAAAEAGGDPSRTAAAISALGTTLNRLSSPVERRLYVQRVGQRFGLTDLQEVQRQLQRGVMEERRQRRPRGPQRRPERASAPRNPRGSAAEGARRPPVGRKSTNSPPAGPMDMPPPRDDEILVPYYDDDGDNTPYLEASEPPPRAAILPPLETDGVVLLLDFPELFFSEDATNFGELLTSPDLRAIFLATSAMYEATGSLDGPTLLAELVGNPASEWLVDRLARPSSMVTSEEVARRALSDVIPRLALRNIVSELPKVQREILTARRNGQDDLADELAHKLEALRKGAAKLQQRNRTKG